MKNTYLTIDPEKIREDYENKKKEAMDFDLDTYKLTFNNK